MCLFRAETIFFRYDAPKKITLADAATPFGHLASSMTHLTDRASADQGYHGSSIGAARRTGCVAILPVIPSGKLIVSFLQHTEAIYRFFTNRCCIKGKEQRQ